MIARPRSVPAQIFPSRAFADRPDIVSRQTIARGEGLDFLELQLHQSIRGAEPEIPLRILCRAHDVAARFAQMNRLPVRAIESQQAVCAPPATRYCPRRRAIENRRATRSVRRQKSHSSFQIASCRKPSVVPTNAVSAKAAKPALKIRSRLLISATLVCTLRSGINRNHCSFKKMFSRPSASSCIA